jgi:integrase
MALTAKFVASAKPGRHLDVDGLYLNVSPTGRKTWVLRFSSKGRVTERSLGSGEFVSLAEAREKAFTMRKAIRTGQPIDKVKAQTFKEVADELLAIKARGWKASSTYQFRLSIDTYAAPLLDKDVGVIGVSDVLTVLKPVWHDKPATANKLRMVIEQVLAAATVKGHRTTPNAAAWKHNLQHLLTRPRKSLHHPAISYMNLPNLMRALEAEGSTISRALRFLTLTGARSSEVLKATWSEIDLQEAVWAVPAARMKMGREHRVPLSAAVLAVLHEQAAVTGQVGFVFPSPFRSVSPKEGTRFDPGAMIELMRRMGERETVPHGMRSTMRDWMGDVGNIERDVAEACLAHVVGGVEGAYRRSTAFEKRRVAMQAWGDFLTA